MVKIIEWDLGESVRLNVVYTDINEVAYDPDTIELRVYAPNGSLDTTVTYLAGEIKRTDVGIYYYDYLIATNALLGWWISKFTGISGTFVDVSEGQFKVRNPSMKLYCTPEEVWLRAGQDETFVEEVNVIDYIKKSMSDIDEIYQKNFQYSNDVTQWFDTNQPDPNTKVKAVFLTYTPVRAITSVKEYDMEGDEVINHTADDYTLDLKTGRIKLRSRSFGHQSDRIEVIYTYGYDAIPESINNLCVILSAMKLHLKFIEESVDQVTSYNACGINVSVGEPYTASAKALELLSKERDKIIGNIGRLRPSVFIG